MQTRCFILIILPMILLARMAAAGDMTLKQVADPPVYPQAPHMGAYLGTLKVDRIHAMPATATVVPMGQDTYRVNVVARPIEPGREGLFLDLRALIVGPDAQVGGWSGGHAWTGMIRSGQLTLGTRHNMSLELERVTRVSPTLGAAPPEGALVLLPFEPGVRPETSAWTNGEWEPREDGSLRVVPGKGANRTVREFSDVRLHVEFMLPLREDKVGQARTNSGVFLNDAYEVQVLDSFGVQPTSGDCGSIYNLARPRVNASLPPGEWQTYDIEFRAPRLNAEGELIEPPRLTVHHNGVLIHDDVEVPFNTRNDDDPHRARGPIVLQDHGDELFFRNIWVVER